ncbi:hypothetical protein [Thermococcus peptonophilus]|uniref:Uncharacterized protein n=1 Tax=Thermococcus peptonophilus TaxID=53952 RepID=A0A142CT77_9EURY|nr:hypothetical protein [Thermococcus peptonophilus]AMQ17979.1 hypothetical protein A0127_01735 [Thermococcus peptonophilus]
MMSIEFEIPLDLLNDVMDYIIEEDAKLQWVRYSKRTNSVVVRVLISAEVVEQFLFGLAKVVMIPLEVTIVEEKIGERLIHEAFLFSVEVSEGIYPVFVLLYYNVSKVYPDKIVVGTLAEAPQELIDAVLSRTVGKLRLLDTEKIKSTVENGVLLIYLRANLPLNGAGAGVI